MQQEVLTSIQMYRHDVLSLPRRTQEEESQIIVEARQGNEQARTQLIEGCLRYVMFIAARYKRDVHHDSYLDLVGVGNVAIMENIEKALMVEHSGAYLRVTAKRAIMHYCFTRASMIMKTNQYTESLDTPIYGESDITLIDLLAAPEPEPEPEAESEIPDYTELYDALEELPEKHREVLARHYGLYGRTPESLYQISQDIGKPGPKSSAAYTREYRALRTLRERLEYQSDTAA